MRGWHWLFLLGGIPCVGLGLLVLFTLKDRIADAHWLTDDEKTYLASRIASHEPNKHGGSLMSALRLPGFLMLGLIYFLIQVASYGLNFWAPQLIRSAGTESPTIIGLLTAVPYICGAISMIVERICREAAHSETIPLVMTGGDHALLLPAMNSRHAISLPHLVPERIWTVVQAQSANNE